MYHDCPLCKTSVYIPPSKEAVCENCKSTIYEASDKSIILLKSGLKLNILNFITAIIYLIGIGVTFYISIDNSKNLIAVGLCLVVIPIMAILKYWWYNDYYDIFTIYLATFNRKLKYYDLGTKFFSILNSYYANYWCIYDNNRLTIKMLETNLTNNIINCWLVTCVSQFFYISW